MPGPLRLKALDTEDLVVLASCLQDTLVMVGDMAFLPEEQRFVLVGNRFGWETPGPDLARVTCAVTFDGVGAVRRRGIDLKESERILSLLTLRPDDGAIELLFSAGAAIRLEMPKVEVYLEDIGDSWPTQWRPSHEKQAGG
jgi:Protein of unknown function (DUF2948)